MRNLRNVTLEIPPAFKVTEPPLASQPQSFGVTNDPLQLGTESTHDVSWHAWQNFIWPTTHRDAAVIN